MLTSAAFVVVPAASWAAPTITSFSPTGGPIGTTVTITGSGFTGTTSVTFHGVASSFGVASATSIRASVPVTSTGPITVTGPSGSVRSTSNFTVLPGIALSRAAGPPTTAITVAGSGFAANEAVDIYEGSTDVMLASTDGNGTFSGIPITISSSAPPGPFWITAVGRHSQIAAQVSFTVRTDWLNLRGDPGGSGWNRYENVLNSSSVSELQAAWTTTAGSYFANVPPGVVVASGEIVALQAHLGTLVALRPDGSQIWSRTLASSFFSGPTPADGNGVLVAASSDGKVHAYALGSGAPRWTTAGPNDTGGGSPVVVGSTDVIVPGAVHMQDFNLSTGALRWAVADPCASAVSTPAVAAGNILYTCRDSSGNPMLNVASTAGAPRNSVAPVGTTATTAPAVVGGDVYTLLGGQLESRSYSGFYQKWAVTPPVSVFSDAVAGDGIVVVCGTGGLFAVNAADGSTRFSNSAFPCTADATIANGVIYEPQAGDVAMFDEFGDALGRLGSGAAVGPPAVVDGSVYAAESISGVDKWSIPTPASTAQAGTRGHARPNVRHLHPNRALKPYRPHRAR